MKQYILRALSLTLLLSITLHDAYGFESEGLYYNILSEEDRTVAVVCPIDYTHKYQYDYIEGNIEIPSRVIYESKTYRVTEIGYKAFRECRRLTSVTIPNSVAKIGDEAFQGCFGVTSVTIPNSVTKLGVDAFRTCFMLTSVTIPNSVTSIGEGSFRFCSGLTSVTISNSVTSIGDHAFSYCSGLTSVTIPNSVISIGEYAFSYCLGLTSVTIPNSVISIGEYAFDGCSGLASIHVDNDNKSYGSINGVLYNKDITTLLLCPMAKEYVEIPNSVTSIGESAFSGYSRLTSIYCHAITPPSGDNSVFGETTLKECKLYVPTGCLSVYESVDPWRNFWNIEEMDFSGIDEAVVGNGKPRISVVNGIIHIGNADDKVLVEVFDISGKKVFRDYGSTVSGLAKGMYIVKVKSDVVKVQL